MEDASQKSEKPRESINAGRLLHLLTVMLIAHPLSMGAVQFASGRGWISPSGSVQDFFNELYQPETWLLEQTPPSVLAPARRGFMIYLMRAYQLGRGSSD